MSKDNLVVKIGQVATRGKHKDGFLFVGTTNPKDLAADFFYLIEIESPWVDGEKIRNSIVSCLRESKLTVESEDTITLFEQIIKGINDNLAEIAHRGEHEWIGKLNAIIGTFYNNEIIFSQTGNISGYLFRGNKISHITEKPLEGAGQLPQKTFLTIINGEIAPDDRVIIANSELYSHISLDRLRQILIGMQRREAIDEIVKILRKNRVKEVNSIIFELGETEDPETERGAADVIMLDEQPESKILKYSKLFYNGVISGVRSAGKGANSAAGWWKKNIQPKIGGKQKTDKDQPTDQGRERPKSLAERFSGLPKINYFHQPRGSGASRAKNFFANLLFWSKGLARPENRKYLYIAAIVILLLAGFIKIQINGKSNSGIKNQADNLQNLNSARDLYKQAIDDLGLKRDGGKEKLIDSRNLAEKASGSTAIKDEAVNLLNQIQSKLDELNNAKRISAAIEASYSVSGEKPLVYAVGSDIFSFSANGEIFRYDTRKKSSANVASIGSKDGKITSLAYSDSLNLFYFYTDSKKVISYDPASSVVNNINLADSKEWENAVAIGLFSTNIYLLDAQSGTIWKHTKNDGNYSAGSSYLQRTPISIAGSESLAIDGDLYVLNSNGSVVKIRKSAEDSGFSLSGTPTPENNISAPVKIFTNADTATIFILDKAENRVLEYSKTGLFKRQFVADKSLGEITDFAVNAKIQKIWLLLGNNLYEIGT